jgi:hypothetical protein
MRGKIIGQPRRPKLVGNATAEIAFTPCLKPSRQMMANGYTSVLNLVASAQPIVNCGT